MIYLDHHATTPVDGRVLDAMRARGVWPAEELGAVEADLAERLESLRRRSAERPSMVARLARRLRGS